MTPEVNIKSVKDVIDNNSGHPESLITVLQDIQREFRYLPREALTEVSDALGVPLSKVYAVATFYNAFSLTPKGEKIVRICQGTACHIKGADLIQEHLETGLGLKPGETSPDLKYSLEVVNCLGVCAMAPVVVVNDKMHGNVRCDRAVRLAKKD
jgi:NADH-quinone oxidoreductase subunit E